MSTTLPLAEIVDIMGPGGGSSQRGGGGTGYLVGTVSATGVCTDFGGESTHHGGPRVFLLPPVPWCLRATMSPAKQIYGERLVIRNLLDLCYFEHRCGGEHPPNVTVLGKTWYEALLAPAREGRQGTKAAPVSRGTTVPLSPPKVMFPHRLCAKSYTISLSKPNPLCTPGKYQPAHIRRASGKPNRPCDSTGRFLGALTLSLPLSGLALLAAFVRNVRFRRNLGFSAEMENCMKQIQVMLNDFGQKMVEMHCQVPPLPPARAARAAPAPNRCTFWLLLTHGCRPAVTRMHCRMLLFARLRVLRSTAQFLASKHSPGPCWCTCRWVPGPSLRPPPPPRRTLALVQDAQPKALPVHRLFLNLLVLRAVQQEWPTAPPPASPLTSKYDHPLPPPPSQRFGGCGAVRTVDNLLPGRTPEGVRPVQCA